MTFSDLCNELRRGALQLLCAAGLALGNAELLSGLVIHQLVRRGARPDMVTVQFDGRPVSRDGTNGWVFTDGTNREIRFNGTSCARHKRLGR